MIPETGVVVNLLFVEDQSRLMVEHADKAVGELTGLRPQHDRCEGLRDALRLNDDIEMGVAESEKALSDGLGDVEHLGIEQIILIQSVKASSNVLDLQLFWLRSVSNCRSILCLSDKKLKTFQTHGKTRKTN